MTKCESDTTEEKTTRPPIHGLQHAPSLHNLLDSLDDIDFSKSTAKDLRQVCREK